MKGPTQPLQADDLGRLHPHPLGIDGFVYTPERPLTPSTVLSLGFLWASSVAPCSPDPGHVVRYVARVVVAIATGTAWRHADGPTVDRLAREMHARLRQTPSMLHHMMDSFPLPRLASWGDHEDTLEAVLSRINLPAIAGSIVDQVASTGPEGIRRALQLKGTLDEALGPSLLGGSANEGAFWWLAQWLPHSNPCSPILLEIGLAAYTDVVASADHAASLPEGRLRDLSLPLWEPKPAREKPEEAPVTAFHERVPYSPGLVLYALLTHFGKASSRGTRSVRIQGGKAGFLRWVNGFLQPEHRFGGATAAADAYAAADWLLSHVCRIQTADGLSEIGTHYVTEVGYHRGAPGRAGYVDIEVGTICLPGYERAHGLLLVPYTLAPVVAASQHLSEMQRTWNLVLTAMVRGPARIHSATLAKEAGAKPALVASWLGAWEEGGHLKRVGDAYEWGNQSASDAAWVALQRARESSKRQADRQKRGRQKAGRRRR